MADADTGRLDAGLSDRACAKILVAICVVNLVVLSYWLRRSPFNADAKDAYMPFARRLLDDGPAFLASPEAVQVPLMGYLWPALFGADLAAQKVVSIVLSLLVLILLFRVGRLLHSRLAGLLCAAAYAFSPLVWPLSATAGTEPLFLFLTACWIWGLAEGVAGRNGGFVAAGLAIGLAALTRASIVYFLPFVVVAAWLLSRLDRGNRDTWIRVCRAHLLAVAVVAPLIIANAIRYGLYAVSTGAGAALFSGNHPLVWGFEQHYFDSVIDIAAVLEPGMSHLEIEADRMLAAVGRFMLLSLDPVFVAEMYAHKLFAFLFVANREWVEPAIYLRTYRILLLVFAIGSAAPAFRNPVLLCVWAAIVFQTILHVPVLFSFRYSVVVLEVGLCVLAGIGVAGMLAEKTRTRFAASTGAFACLALLGGWHALAFPAIPAINLDVPHLVEKQFEVDRLPVSRLEGMTVVADGRYVFERDHSSFDIVLADRPALLPGTQRYLALWAAEEPSGASSAGCDQVVAAFRPENAPTAQFGPLQRFAWTDAPSGRRAVIGGYWKLRFRGQGVFLVQFNCPAGSELHIGRMQVIQPIVGFYYRMAYLRSLGRTGWSESAH